MSSSETFALAISSVLAAGLWITWLYAALAVARRCSGTRERWLLLVTPAFCAALLFQVLTRLAADDVRGDPIYIFFYLVMGAAWVAVGIHGLALLGLSLRDDVIERGNRAAGVALAGALVGLTLCYAGGNIGNGPGWWVVVFSAGLATGTLFLLWFALDQVSGLADTVTIDRDRAAGLRLAGYFVAGGLILGRAVAGDWESAAGTVADFVKVGWPVAPLFLAAFLLERSFRPTPERPERSVALHGWVPFLLAVSLAGLYVYRLGGWE